MWCLLECSTQLHEIWSKYMCTKLQQLYLTVWWPQSADLRPLFMYCTHNLSAETLDEIRCMHSISAIPDSQGQDPTSTMSWALSYLMVSVPPCEHTEFVFHVNIHMCIVVQDGRTCSCVWPFPLTHPISSVYCPPWTTLAAEWPRVRKQLLAARELHTCSRVGGGSLQLMTYMYGVFLFSASVLVAPRVWHTGSKLLPCSQFTTYTLWAQSSTHHYPFTSTLCVVV